MITIKDRVKLCFARHDIFHFLLQVAVKYVEQGLINLCDFREAVQEFLIPFRIVAEQVVRVNDMSVAARLGHNFERFFQVQVSVIIRQFFTCGDVADGNLELVRRGETVGLRTVVYESRIVPTEDIMAFGIPVGILIQDLLVQVVHPPNFRRGELAVQFVEYPCNGSLGYRFQRYDSVAYLFVDKAEFRIWMDHGGF